MVGNGPVGKWPTRMRDHTTRLRDLGPDAEINRGIRYVSTRDVVKHDPVSSSMILSDQKGGVVDLDSSQLPSRRGF